MIEKTKEIYVKQIIWNYLLVSRFKSDDFQPLWNIITRAKFPQKLKPYRNILNNLIAHSTHPSILIHNYVILFCIENPFCMFGVYIYFFCINNQDDKLLQDNIYAVDFDYKLDFNQDRTYIYHLRIFNQRHRIFLVYIQLYHWRFEGLGHNFHRHNYLSYLS